MNSYFVCIPDKRNQFFDIVKRQYQFYLCDLHIAGYCRDNVTSSLQHQHFKNIFSFISQIFILLFSSANNKLFFHKKKLT